MNSETDIVNGLEEVAYIDWGITYHRRICESYGHFTMRKSGSSKHWWLLSMLVAVLVAVASFVTFLENFADYMHVVVCGAALLCFMCVYPAFIVTEESLLVIPYVGLQHSVSNLFGSERRTFIDQSRIDDIVLNEAITMNSIIVYLAVLTCDPLSKQRTAIFPVFAHVRPRTDVLVDIYKEVHRLVPSIGLHSAVL